MTDKVVFLAFSNPEKIENDDTVSMLSCVRCSNKTYRLRYYKGDQFPTLECSACGADAGKIGWIDK